MRDRFGISVISLAAGASLLAHALILATFSVVRVRVGEPAESAEMWVYFDEPAATQPVKDHASVFEIGRSDGTGYATHEAQGRQQQVAREATQDQPSLSLDPLGSSTRVEVPSEPVMPAARHVPVSVPDSQVLPPPRESLQVVREALGSALAGLERVEGEALVPSSPEVTVPAVAEAPAPIPEPVVPQAPAPVAQQIRGTGADPAPQSDSEVDPFSSIGSIEFRGGRTIDRAGRRVKPRRPKIQLAGLVDLFGNSGARVILKVAIDETGRVTDVRVARSSGSNEIDQPCRVAMYDWWFEPKKGPDGKPVSDSFPFAIDFR